MTEKFLWTIFEMIKNMYRYLNFKIFFFSKCIFNDALYNRSIVLIVNFCRLVNMTVIRNLVQRKISNLVAEIKGKYEEGRLMFLIKTSQF